jgi:hypothetical protein
MPRALSGADVARSPNPGEPKLELAEPNTGAPFPDPKMGTEVALPADPDALIALPPELSDSWDILAEPRGDVIPNSDLELPNVEVTPNAGIEGFIAAVDPAKDVAKVDDGDPKAEP